MRAALVGLGRAMTFDCIELTPQKEAVRSFYKDMWDHAATKRIPNKRCFAIPPGRSALAHLAT